MTRATSTASIGDVIGEIWNIAELCQVSLPTIKFLHSHASLPAISGVMNNELFA
jgi:hypothetical protein